MITIVKETLGFRRSDNLIGVAVTCGNILTLQRSIPTHIVNFTAVANTLLPNPDLRRRVPIFGTLLSPDNLRRKIS